MLVVGADADSAEVLVAERAAGLRSQPGQFALPGGGAEPADADDIATALREAEEETGLDPRGVDALGAFAPVAMPWRGYDVVPVVAWAARRPGGLRADGIETDRLVWARLRGERSLTDPAVRCRATMDGAAVGPAFDLADGAFVWGFTAHLLDGLLGRLGLLPEGARRADVRRAEVPPERRR